MLNSFALWRDGRGRISPLRIVALLLLLAPIAIFAFDWWSLGHLPARLLNNVIHRTGYWALLFILISLAITPLRRVGRYPQLLDVRRMIGVGAFCYAFTHLLLYIADQSYDLIKVGSEIVLRLYLTIGFIALLGLGALAATSTDGMVRRLGGKRWQRLHQLIYGIALLAIIHFFQQTKLDVTIPTFIAALFAWLIGYRFLVRNKKPREELSTLGLLLLTLTVAVLTFAIEAVVLGMAFRISPLRVLQTAFDFDITIRPGWVALGAGLAVVLLDLGRLWWGKMFPAQKSFPAESPRRAAAARPQQAS